MRKVIAFLTALMIPLSILSGCGSSGSSSSSQGSSGSSSGSSASTAPESGSVTVWTWDDNYNVPIMQRAAEYYNKTKPDVKVDVVGFDKGDVYTKLQTALAAGTGNGLPDIVMLEDYVSGKFLSTFFGGFADLSDKVDYSNFLDFKVDAVSYDGRAYGIPLDTGASTLFYRKDMIEKAGYQEEDMQDLTWEEFIEIGKAVKEATGNYMVVEMAANKTTLIRNMLQSAGTWYFSPNGEINIQENDALAEAFKLISEMKEAGILFEAESVGDRAGSLNKGTVASIVNGPWMAATLQAAPEQEGLWRIAPTPRYSNITGAVNASNLGGSSWYVPEQAKNKEIAIDLLESVYAHNVDFYKDILLAQSCVSGFVPALSGEIFETEEPFFGGQKVYKEYAHTLELVPGVNYGGYVAEANDAVSAALANYMTGKLSLDQALESAQSQLKNQLGR